MEKKYFYLEYGKQLGPFTKEEFIQRGLPDDTLVWFYGLKEWTPLKDLSQLAKDKIAVIEEPHSEPTGEENDHNEEEAIVYAPLSKDVSDEVQSSKVEILEENKSDVTSDSDSEPVDNSTSKNVNDSTNESNPNKVEVKKEKKKLFKHKVNWLLLCLCVVFVILVGIIVTFSVITYKINHYNYPDYVETFSEKKSIYYKQPNEDLARKLVDKSKQAKNAGLTELATYYMLEASLYIDDDNSLLMEIGVYLNKDDVKKYSKAYELLERINMPLMSQSEQSIIYANKGWCAYKAEYSNDYAISQAQKAILIDPNNELAVITLYCVYYNRENWTQVLKWTNKAIALDDDFLQNHYYKAVALQKLKRYSEALNEYAYVCRNDKQKKYTNALYNYLECYPKVYGE